MLVVGLTGGIGSGKSTAAAYFQQLGVPVIDADQIAHDLVTPGQPALTQIADQFGQHILTEDGQLDRAKLRECVFADPQQRHRLESLLHPLIREEIRRRIARLQTPYVIVAIPLLVETQQFDLVDRVLVIDTEQQLQIERVRQRDHLDSEAIMAILQAQASREQRLARADDIIVNNGDKA